MDAATSASAPPDRSTAEALMRSRYAAFERRDAAWLLGTWHPSTRPAALELSPATVWRGLQIVDTVDGGPDDDSGVVEFRAAYIDYGRYGMLHERSRFVREGGRWYYLDGDAPV